jgi:hypothetical protein
VQVDGFASREGEWMRVGLSLQNAGVGPALLRRVALYHHDVLVPDSAALRAALPPGDLSQVLVTGRVLAAGDRVRPFELRYPAPPEADAVAIMQALGEAWRVEVCYCSSLQECWLANASDAVPGAVDHCEAGDASAL